MKKTLALILAIVMVCAFATTAFAAQDLVGTVNQGSANDYTEGVDSITGGSKVTNIAITATTGDVSHRYAVDIDYDELTFEISRDALVWDVNALEYVTPAGTITTMEDKVFELTVTNRSDMPVNITSTLAKGIADDTDKLSLDLYYGHVELDNGAVINQTDDEKNLAVNSYYGNDTIVNGAAATPITTSNPVEIAKAKVHEAAVYPFSLVATSDNWNSVVDYYATLIATGNGTSHTVATLTVAISAVQAQGN